MVSPTRGQGGRGGEDTCPGQTGERRPKVRPGRARAAGPVQSLQRTDRQDPSELEGLDQKSPAGLMAALDTSLQARFQVLRTQLEMRHEEPCLLACIPVGETAINTRQGPEDIQGYKVERAGRKSAG